MITPSKKAKLQIALKSYSKKYLNGKITDLDESGTRILINSFLTEVLGFQPIEEVKTEYMIRGTYADYMIQKNGTRHFLVEVKSFSLELSDKHLRQAINYGANEGIEWALLTNGKSFELYKILFNKPIESKKVISINLTDEAQLKSASDILQFLHRDSVFNDGLDDLWNKYCALDAPHLASYMLAPQVISFVKKHLKSKFKCKFSDEEIQDAVYQLIKQPVNIELVKPLKSKVIKKKPAASVSEVAETVVELGNTQPISSN